MICFYFYLNTRMSPDELMNDAQRLLFSVGSSLTTSDEGNYWVLSTDYNSYSLVWSCTDLGLFNTRMYFFNLFIIMNNVPPIFNNIQLFNI